MLFFSKSAAIIDTQMRLGQALFCKKVQGAATTSAGLEMHKCRGGSSTGAGFRHFPSHSMHRMCPVAPFRRGQRCGPWTAGTTLRVAPCPPTARPRVAHRSTAPGGTPPGTPRRASARPTFLKISPEARKPSGLRPARCACPFPAGRQAAGARGREATGGAAQGGRGAARPAAVEPP